MSWLSTLRLARRVLPVIDPSLAPQTPVTAPVEQPVAEAEQPGEPAAQPHGPSARQQQLLLLLR